MNLRKKAFILSCIEFCVFSVIGISLVMVLFHAGILALPVIGFMWTFWGFNVFTVIFGVAVEKRHKFSFAFLNLLALSLILTFLINSSESTKNEKVQLAAIILSCITALLYFLDTISFVRTYWKPVKHEVLRFLGKETENFDALQNDCASKYPVFFVHGTGFRDRTVFNYWSEMPELLMKRGAKVFYSRHDAWANIEDAAAQISESLKKIISETGAEKVNVIAHSKGGIDVRYAIAKLGIAENIASFTMISSPNRGSKTLEKLFSIFGEGIFKFCAVFVNLGFKISGDKKPDFFRAVSQFRSSYMEKFNAEILDNPSIFVQSFAGKMKNPFSDIFMGFLNFVLGLFDGENDGLVSVESAKWGNFRGTLEGKSFVGISHSHEVDGYRTNPKLSEHEGLPAGSKTIRDFYVNLVRELKEKGF